MSQFDGFPKDTFRFLASLSKNNNREWFAENKALYESAFLQPALSLIQAMEEPLEELAPWLKADARKVGGSLMRIYKDTRFSKDKTPYKTNIGIHFRHRAGKDVHAPGFYLHIAQDETFLAAGIWRPPSEPLRCIREYMAEYPEAWTKVKRNKGFRSHFELYADRLRAAPRGFSKEHPLIEDLKLKSFIGMQPLSREQIMSANLLSTIQRGGKKARPLMEFLCSALNQPY